MSTAYRTSPSLPTDSFSAAAPRPSARTCFHTDSGTNGIEPSRSIVSGPSSVASSTAPVFAAWLISPVTVHFAHSGSSMVPVSFTVSPLGSTRTLRFWRANAGLPSWRMVTRVPVSVSAGTGPAPLPSGTFGSVVSILPSALT